MYIHQLSYFSPVREFPLTYHSELIDKIFSVGGEFRAKSKAKRNLPTANPACSAHHVAFGQPRSQLPSPHLVLTALALAVWLARKLRHIISAHSNDNFLSVHDSLAR